MLNSFSLITNEIQNITYCIRELSVYYFLRIPFLNEIYLYVYLYVILKVFAVQKAEHVHESLQNRELNTKLIQIRVIY